MDLSVVRSDSTTEGTATVRRAARRDANEPQLVKIARQLGAQMEFAGPLDWWCCWRGDWVPVEIKRPDGPRGGRKGRHYTPAQVSFLARCKQSNAPVWTWRTERDLMACLGARVSA